MPTYFCCCCNLRPGCIVYSWLQMMLIVFIITGLSSPLILLDWNYIPQRVFAPMQPAFSVIIAMQVIKSLTCISLTWGLAKNNYIFYQPWLFIQGTENIILSLGIITIFGIGIVCPPIFICLIPVGFVTGLYWYFWICVYTIYKMDKMQTLNGQYDALTMTSTLECP